MIRRGDGEGEKLEQTHQTQQLTMSLRTGNSRRIEKAVMAGSLHCTEESVRMERCAISLVCVQCASTAAPSCCCCFGCSAAWDAKLSSAPSASNASGCGCSRVETMIECTTCTADGMCAVASNGALSLCVQSKRASGTLLENRKEKFFLLCGLLCLL